jgi:hypothetical protein
MRNNVCSLQGIINSVDKKQYINVIILVTAGMDSGRLVYCPSFLSNVPRNVSFKTLKK